jgi:hypothetical protein
MPSGFLSNHWNIYHAEMKIDDLCDRKSALNADETTQNR